MCHTIAEAKNADRRTCRRSNSCCSSSDVRIPLRWSMSDSPYNHYNNSFPSEQIYIFAIGIILTKVQSRLPYALVYESRKKAIDRLANKRKHWPVVCNILTFRNILKGIKRIADHVHIVFVIAPSATKKIYICYFLQKFLLCDLSQWFVFRIIFLRVFFVVQKAHDPLINCRETFLY